MDKTKKNIISGSNILIADDMPENIMLLGKILQTEKANVLVAQNGLQAVNTAKRDLPDMILMDVNMPEMDGFDATKLINENEETKHIPIIFLTAMSEVSDVVKGFDFGGVDYVTKPFDKKILLSRIKTHLDLKFSKEKLEKANKEKIAFFSLLAHDLRSPLSGVMGVINILNDEFDDLSNQEIIEIIEIIKFSVDKQFAFLTNLLEWGTIQFGNKKIEKSNFNLKTTFQKSIDVLKLNSEKKNIETSYILDDVELNVYGQKDMIYSVIHNLVNNAIKFSNQYGNILIKGESTEDGVLISVEDDGIGMSEKIAGDLFVLDKSRSRNGTNGEKGTGLGLLLCEEIVKKHGGKIWVESEVGKGSKFYFTLMNKES
jgi:two-component system, sensor histidine kinase and response regulator